MINKYYLDNIYPDGNTTGLYVLVYFICSVYDHTFMIVYIPEQNNDKKYLFHKRLPIFCINSVGNI